MTIKEFYTNIEGDYEEMVARFQTEERIEKFICLFAKDDSYSNFQRAVEEGNVSEAFRAMHTLKGVCMNLSFTSLGEIASEMTEQLREGKLTEALASVLQLADSYEKHMEMLAQYEREIHG